MRYLVLALFLGLFFSLFIIVNGRFFLEKPLASLNENYDKQYNLQIISDDEIPKLTLEKIFQDDHDWTRVYTETKIRTLLVTGDVMLARSVNKRTTNSKDFTWPFLNVADVLQQADITYINLETPLIANCSVTDEGMRFCGDLRNIEGLIFAGVDIANIANNHIYDQGENGAAETANLLKKNIIIPVGLSGAATKDIDGYRFAFLGYNDVDYSSGRVIVDEEKIEKEIFDARTKSDIVIVQFHWGNEYTTKITDRQKHLAHLAIDSGADLVIGNHPHWIQPIEIYKEKLIVYSHGNFIFDQEWSKNTKLGVVGKYTFYEDKLIDVEFLPIEIVNYGQPYFLKGNEKLRVIEDMKNESLKVSS